MAIRVDGPTQQQTRAQGPAANKAQQAEQLKKAQHAKFDAARGADNVTSGSALASVQTPAVSEAPKAMAAGEILALFEPLATRLLAEPPATHPSESFPLPPGEGLGVLILSPETSKALAQQHAELTGEETTESAHAVALLAEKQSETLAHAQVQAPPKLVGDAVKALGPAVGQLKAFLSNKAAMPDLSTVEFPSLAGVDIEQLVILVMQQIGKDVDTDLRTLLDEVKKTNAKKAGLRERTTQLKHERAELGAQAGAELKALQKDGKVDSTVSLEDYLAWRQIDPQTMGLVMPAPAIPESFKKKTTAPPPDTTTTVLAQAQTIAFASVPVTESLGNAGAASSVNHPNLQVQAPVQLQLQMPVQRHPQATYEATVNGKPETHTPSEWRKLGYIWIERVEVDHNGKTMSDNGFFVPPDYGKTHELADLKDGDKIVQTFEASNTLDNPKSTTKVDSDNKAYNLGYAPLTPEEQAAADKAAAQAANPPAPPASAGPPSAQGGEGKAHGMSFAALDGQIDATKDQQDSVGDLSQEQQLKLQMLMERRSKAIETLSNTLKKISDTASGIIGNMK